MKLESKIVKSSHPENRIFSFVSDFRNFTNFIPADKISNWEAGEDSCNFSMDLLGRVRMTIVERTPFSTVKVESDPSVTQYNFTLWIQLKEMAEDDTRIRLSMEPKLNPVLLSMVKGYLKEFLDKLAEEMAGFEFPR